MSVHARILAVSHELDDELQRIAMDASEPSPEQVDRARQFSVKATMAAFDGNIPHDFGATKVSAEQLVVLLEQFEGALKLAKTLREMGVIYPAPTRFERILAAFRV